MAGSSEWLPFGLWSLEGFSIEEGYWVGGLDMFAAGTRSDWVPLV